MILSLNSLKVRNKREFLHLLPSIYRQWKVARRMMKYTDGMVPRVRRINYVDLNDNVTRSLVYNLAGVQLRHMRVVKLNAYFVANVDTGRCTERLNVIRGFIHEYFSTFLQPSIGCRVNDDHILGEYVRGNDERCVEEMNFQFNRKFSSQDI